jgi:hypothetical protein
MRRSAAGFGGLLFPQPVSWAIQKSVLLVVRSELPNQQYSRNIHQSLTNGS